MRNDDFLYFKFRAINKHLIESLVAPSLYFASPDALNDPFDCQLDIRASFARAAETTTGTRKTSLVAALRKKGLLESFSKQFRAFGVCSFSLLKNGFDEPLLWSHYADSHKGVCLLYRFPLAFLNDSKNIVGVDTVKYESDILTNWLQNSSIEPSAREFVTELTKIYLTAKSPSWSYEQEARIIRPRVGTLAIPYGTLEQVCFGLRTPQEDIKLITTLAKQYSGCRKFCQVVRGKNDFGMTVQDR